MSDRFWNDDVPELAVNIGELKDWLASNVQEACRQQIDELSCHVSYEDGCGGSFASSAGEGCRKQTVYGKDAGSAGECRRFLPR